MSGISISPTTVRKTVAIVDDDDAARDALEFLLTVLGRHSRAFSSPAVFLEEQADDFGCLLLDQHMPGMTGLELAKHLRSGNNAIPIMLITGALTADIRIRAYAIGIDEVCEKPPEPDMIAAFVERSLVSRSD
jgi:FixJ family two-component response regulator